MRRVIVNIFPSAANSLNDTATRHAPNETGGVLTGTRQILEDTLEYNILGVLGIADFDEFRDIYFASPTEFVCTDRLGWANFALKAVQTFGMSYIGDWHSHPNSGLTVLSSRDVQHLAQQYLLGQFNPFPPLHVLLNWRCGENLNISANIMVGEVIVVINPELIENETGGEACWKRA